MHGGGCACKIPPGELEKVLTGLDPWTSPDLLVGLDTGDDAAVVRIGPGQAEMVSTTDFFTAVLDDGYDFGRVAAANALSDIYAMGATPVMALNLVGWPRDMLPLELLGEVLRGGADICPAGPGTTGRRAEHRRSRTQIRDGGDRPGRPGSPTAQRLRSVPGCR